MLQVSILYFLVSSLLATDFRVDTSVAGVNTSRPELVSLFSWLFEHRSFHNLRDVFCVIVYDLHHLQSIKIHDFLLLFKTLNGLINAASKS